MFVENTRQTEELKMTLMCPAKVARQRAGEGLKERVEQSYAHSRVASAVMQQSR
jgi:urease gamma subunit